jgi:hypothetical protein
VKFLPIVTKATEKVSLATSTNKVAGQVASLGLVGKDEANIQSYNHRQSARLPLPGHRRGRTQDPQGSDRDRQRDPEEGVRLVELTRRSQPTDLDSFEQQSRGQRRRKRVAADANHRRTAEAGHVERRALLDDLDEDEVADLGEDLVAQGLETRAPAWDRLDDDRVRPIPRGRRRRLPRPCSRSRTIRLMLRTASRTCPRKSRRDGDHETWLPASGCELLDGANPSSTSGPRTLSIAALAVRGNSRVSVVMCDSSRRSTTSPIVHAVCSISR